MQYITIVERTESAYHRSKIILHDGMYYFAEFANLDQLNQFAATLGFSYELRETRETERFGKYEVYNISHKIDNGWHGFFSLDELPENTKPFKALSNGSNVTCYFANDGKTITIYRPNPNSKEVYKPLSHNEHIAHKRIYGTY